MAASKKIKQKLKAASRRRAKRAAAVPTASSTATTTSPSTVDVVGRICSVLLEDRELQKTPRDRVAISALRSCLKHDGEPNQAALAIKLNHVKQEDGVTERSYRSAIGDLLEIATQHQESNTPDSFLRYVKILSG